MPVALRHGGLRYYFFSNGGGRLSRPIFMSRVPVATQRYGWNQPYQ